MMYLKKIKYSIIIILLFSTISLRAFADDMEEAKFFGDFIYDVASLPYAADRNLVCSFGYDAVVAVMQQRGNIVNVDIDSENYETCKVIYIAKDKEKIYKSYIAKFNKMRIVTISLIDNFNENGGMILAQMGRRNFELSINSEKIKEAGIKLAPMVIDLVINN